MKKITALLSLLFAVLLTACDAPQDLDKGTVQQNIDKTANAADLYKGKAAFDRGDYAAALLEWRPLAEQGNARAQFLLGYMNGHGQGVPQDDTKAAKWYRKAAEQGHASAQNNLGQLYESGLGVGPDDAEAKKWYRKAAAQGNENAKRNLVMVGRSPSDRMVQDLIWRMGKKAN